MTAAKTESSSLTAGQSAAPPRVAHAPRYVFLDGLRGLAALWVVLFHFVNVWVSPMADQMEKILPHWLHVFLSNGDLGVEVFFVLSGFVIVHSIFGETITPGYFGNFVVRRTIRLGPPYWAMVAFHYLWPYFVFPTKVLPQPGYEGFFQQVGGWPNVFYNIFFLPDLVGTLRMVDVSWTLFLEVQFYLFFVLLIAILQLVAKIPSRAVVRSIIAIAFTALAAYSIYRWFFMKNGSGGQIEDFPSRWYVFFTGAIVYWTTKKMCPRWATWLFLLIVAGLSIAFHERRGGATAAVGMIMMIACDLNKQSTWLNAGWIQYLAKISYSLFLIHVPIGSGIATALLKFGDNSTANVLTAFFIGVMCSIIAADLMYRLIELPSLEIVKKLKPKKPRHAAPRTQPD